MYPGIQELKKSAVEYSLDLLLTTVGWSEYVGLTGIHLGKDSFNRAIEESLSDNSLTVDGVVEAAKSQIADKKS